MEIDDLGWEQYRKNLKSENAVSTGNIARVAVENRGSYVLYSQSGELEGTVRGRFRHNKRVDSEYPKVGDWVIFEKLQGEDKAIIKSILPRQSKISRKKQLGDSGEQIIATNIEIAFIVQGMDGDLDVGRLERYMAMAKEGNCEPVLLLNKCDTVEDGQAIFERMQKTFPGTRVFLISAQTGIGIEKVRSLVAPGISVVFIGSSGAGKSTLINRLLGIERQQTGAVRLADSRGRHTTTRRELILLDSGGILIDTPGIRELEVWTEKPVVAEVFEDINVLSWNCKFTDCDHQYNQGCAVVEAVRGGGITQSRYQAFLRMKKGSALHQKRRVAR